MSILLFLFEIYYMFLHINNTKQKNEFYSKRRKTHYRFRRKRYNTTIIDSSPCQLSEEDIVLPVKIVFEFKNEKKNWVWHFTL